jgi:hypothetical protein
MKDLLKRVTLRIYPHLFGMMFGIGENILNLYNVNPPSVKGHST